MKNAVSKSALLESVGVIDFCNRICEDDDVAYIMAIARRMPRLLEFVGEDKKCNAKIITERALPWLDRIESGKRLRVADDVINVGTTISHYLDYANRRFPNLDADVQIFAARKEKEAHHAQARATQKKFKFVIQDSLDESAYDRFETALPLELLRLGKPYDVDFPIINLPLTSDDYAKTPEDWVETLASHFPSVHNLTVPSQRESGVTSVSIIDPLELNIANLISIPGSDYSPNPKVRLYFSSSERIVRVVPICIPVIPSEAFDKDGLAIKGAVGDLFRRLRSSAAQGDPFPNEPLYNLIVYLISFEYGRRFLPTLTSLIPTGTPYLKENDLDLLFGDTVAGILGDSLKSILNSDAEELRIRQKLPDRATPTGPINAEVANLVLHSLKTREYAHTSPQWIFRESMRILDECFKCNNPPVNEDAPYPRLRRGLPLYDLWWLVSSLSSERRVGFEEMSFLLDFYIDVGAVVPVVSIVNGSYMRTYRRGESNPIEFPSFVHGLLQRHEEAFPDNPLQLTEFTKILAAIGIYHPVKTPLTPKFEYHGMVPFVKSDEMGQQQLEEAIELLKRKHVIHLIEASEETNQTSFQL